MYPLKGVWGGGVSPKWGVWRKCAPPPPNGIGEEMCPHKRCGKEEMCPPNGIKDMCPPKGEWGEGVHPPQMGGGEEM